jgi:hypothetical protein
MINFKVGSVGHNLSQMVGVWHDQISLFHLDGAPLSDDTQAGSGTPGASPFENLVYISFDGQAFSLTNIHIAGRPPIAKTFTGRMRDGLMVFDPLGSGAYENVGMSGGPGILTFNAHHLGPGCDIYMEPDFIMLTSETTRIRHTVLYRDGSAVRTLTARGMKLTDDPSVRHALDPRGSEGEVHGPTFSSEIWSHLLNDTRGSPRK